jgi:hypothetical protein
MKKMYFAPEVEEIELELQNALLDMSTDNGDNNSDEIDDL